MSSVLCQYVWLPVHALHALIPTAVATMYVLLGSVQCAKNTSAIINIALYSDSVVVYCFSVFESTLRAHS